MTPGKKAGLFETMVTFGVSAMWHGLYPFYYIMFFFCALIVELSKEVYRSRALFSFLPPVASHIISHCCTMFLLNYLGTSFNMLTFERGFIFGKGTYFIPYIIIFGMLLIWKVFGISKIA